MTVGDGTRGWPVVAGRGVATKVEPTRKLPRQIDEGDSRKGSQSVGMQVQSRPGRKPALEKSNVLPNHLDSYQGLGFPRHGNS